MTSRAAQRSFRELVVLNIHPIFACAILGIVATTGCVASDISSSNVEQTAIDPFAEELFSQRCGVCHQLETVTDRRASADEWHEIVQRMLSYGAQLNDAEANAIAAYLTDKYGQSDQT